VNFLPSLLVSRPMNHRFAILLGVVLNLAACSFGAIIGTNIPAQPLTRERIARLPEPQQAAWKNYLNNSQQQLNADKNFLLAELKTHNLKQTTPAPSARSFANIPLSRDAAWYSSEQARRIADIIVSFQTPSGGWSKRLDMTSHVRSPGEHFAADNRSLHLGDSDFDSPQGGGWSYVGTFDNDATTTQLRFLARVIAALDKKESTPYQTAFLRGLDYIFAAQFPNGGWPQVWPLIGGYHDAITYNDGAMIHVMELLSDVANAKGDFAFVSQSVRKRAETSLQKGVECLLTTQIVVDGRRKAWCQQHDPLTLKPTSARNYEMPCVTSAESAGILAFLMRLPQPDSNIVTAINAAGAWLEKTQVRDVAFRTVGDDGRHLVPAPGQGPIWARYYDATTDLPIFGDRDKSIHDTVEEISRERRIGYSWYNDAPESALNTWLKWESHPNQLAKPGNLSAQ